MRNKQASRASLRERVRQRVHQAFNPPPPPPKDFLKLGVHPVTGEPVGLRARDLNTHLHVIGGSRRGKTNALRYFAKSLIRRKQERGEGFAVIDPHGGLAEYILELCAKHPELASDVVYLNLKDVSRVLALNVLQQTGQEPYFVGRCVGEALIQAFDQARSDDKKTTIKVFTNMGEALHRLGLTLVESQYFLNSGDEDEAVLRSLITQLPRGGARSAWEHHVNRTAHDAEMAVVGPGNRLDDLIRPLLLRRMLGQDVCVDFLALMNRGGIALFDTSLGENTEITTDGQARLNALLVQQFRQAFPRRKDKGARDYDRKKWPPFTLILDEFGDYCSSEFARTLTQASKFGLRCVFAHQNLKQLIGRDGDETLLSAVLAIPNKLVFGNLVDKDAEILAKHMYLAQFNVDEIKYQQDIAYWDPEIKEVWLQSYGHSTGSGTSRGAGGSRGTSTDEETSRRAAQETTSEQSTDTDSEGFDEKVQQAYQTFYRKRVEKGPPVFRSVDEQVFKAAQALATSPRGVSVLAREDQSPMVCVVPNMDKRPATLEERDRFAASLYTTSRFGTYRDAAEADKQLEERQRKLLEAAPPPEGRVKVRRSKATVPRKPEPETS